MISVDIHAIKGKRKVKEEIYALKGHLNLVEAVIGKSSPKNKVAKFIR